MLSYILFSKDIIMHVQLIYIIISEVGASRMAEACEIHSSGIPA